MIKEVIVVEGKNDTIAVTRAVEADTIETGGLAITEELIQKLKLVQERRGIIIFTDPDYAGERIRRVLSERVEGCKHAFLPRIEALENGDIGVENASPEAIKEALLKVRTEADDRFKSPITWDEMVSFGLTGGKGSKEMRMVLGDKLGIGYGNGQQFFKRLRVFGISRDEFLSAYTSAAEERK
ncbi:ribonuclease M5 [Microaerobacter geothermalis]|uniref:ribonuclease M5 n=1 Tax=Microaerobacter geothermalis TaxID=674972 RepID=UPI001F170666|nr:ribonuclease M5 [Microaerobacter geothermalis]MCF6095152.1 ribonuclease M5 [Microaerobacter geothermalis]